MAAIAWFTGARFGTLSGDGIAFTDAAAHFAGSALFGLVAGAIAFALAPLVGRSLSAGVGAAALFGAYLVNAYAGMIPAFDSLKGLSWFAWTAKERPLAGSWDLPSLLPVVGLILVFLALGVLAFERRDLGSSVPLPSASLPGRRFLLRGPARLAFLGSRTAALTWGLGIGIYAWFVASAGRAFATQFASNPGTAKLMDQVSMGIDWRTSGGFLQLAFVAFGFPLMALAGATFVNALAADEHERRLDLLLSTPVSRARWLVAGGIGVYASIALLSLVVALITALGALQAGGDPTQPFVGMGVAALYAVALAGVGIAVFGLGAGELAAPATAALAIGFLTFDFVGSALRLSPDLLALSLTRHLGQPLAGVYDWPGMLLLVTLALGGLAVGAWGMHRRDLST
jgi:ABC-2 type transport system permease protein